MFATRYLTRTGAVLTTTAALLLAVPATAAMARPLGGPSTPTPAAQSVRMAPDAYVATHQAPTVSYTQSYWGANPGSRPTTVPANNAEPTAGNDGIGGSTIAALIGALLLVLAGVVAVRASRSRRTALHNS